MDTPYLKKIINKSIPLKNKIKILVSKTKVPIYVGECVGENNEANTRLMFPKPINFNQTKNKKKKKM